MSDEFGAALFDMGENIELDVTSGEWVIRIVRGDNYSVSVSASKRGGIPLSISKIAERLGEWRVEFESDF